jgi:hypothetical protein
MTDYEPRKAEMELRNFTSAHFEKPSECRNPDQIRIYVSEPARRIEELEATCNYAPLLAQYRARQNSFLAVDFTNTYR